MTSPILARDIMVTKLITLSPDLGLRDAAKLLLKNRISGAPVVDEAGRLIGIFSEKDMLTALIDAAYDELPSSNVSAYMSRDVHTIDEQADILAIAQVFRTKDFRRLPVVQGDKLVGQISRRDVMCAVVKLLEPIEDHKAAILYLSGLREPPEAPVD